MLNFLIMTFNLSKRKDGAMPSWSGICISWPIIHTRKLWKFSFHPHLIFRKKWHKRIYTSSITFAARFWYQEFNSGFATLLQNELNSDVARFTIHVQNRKVVARFLRVVKRVTSLFNSFCSNVIFTALGNNSSQLIYSDAELIIFYSLQRT